ncbi:MAG: TetR/AcrR family transcriptional regulator [Anaerolineae bacterium]
MMAEQTHIDLRDRIVDAARELFVARGYIGISMREIAEAVGVSKAALYYHFRDKESLFLAVLFADLADLGRCVETARAASSQVEERVRAIAASILSLPPERRAIIRLVSQEMAQLSEDARRSFHGMYQDLFINPLGDVLAEGIARGELKPVDPGQLTWILLGMMYPFFYPAHAAELGDPMASVDLIVDVFFHGVGA